MLGDVLELQEIARMRVYFAGDRAGSRLKGERKLLQLQNLKTAPHQTRKS
jgi:hypothetical protein